MYDAGQEFAMSEGALGRLETDPIGRLLAEYAFPAIGSMVIISLYNIFSSIFIGHGVGALDRKSTRLNSSH